MTFTAEKKNLTHFKYPIFSTADDVYGDVPGVHEATQVDQTEGDGAENQDWAQEVGQQDESGEEDAGQSDTEIPEELPGDHLVCLPVGIFLAQQ